jgi:uncharacterized RDD family membrane protein YckC
MVTLKLPRARESIVFANPLKRIAAFLVDFFILQILVISAFASYFQNYFPKNNGNFGAMYSYISSHPSILMQMYNAFIALGIIIIVYFTFLEYKYSTTLGKMIFSLHVESTSSKELTFWQCLLRNIYILPVFPIFILGFVDFFYFLIRGQRLSEILSRTKTVEVMKYGY